MQLRYKPLKAVVKQRRTLTLICRVLASVVGFAALESLAVEEEPSIQISPGTQAATITFRGTLLVAENSEGPWTALTNATSPHVAEFSTAQKFFRSRASLTNSIFSSSTIVPFTLTGPFQEHFEMAYAGIPDGIFPPVREKPYFDGTLIMADLVVPVSIRVRGNSSLQECPFPKMKFKVAKEDRPGTPFFDAREVKIGTHCADGGHGNIGRLRDQIAAYREELAYETMGLMGFTTPRVRRARIEYRDTTPATNDASTVGWRLSRQAMLVEDIELVAARLGARVLTADELAALENPPFDKQLVADLQFFNVLLGNWDYALAWDGRGVWNTEVLEMPDKSLLPVAGDFDLASWVTGVPQRSYPHEYHPELTELERETLYQLEQIKLRVEATNFVAAIQRFTARRDALESEVLSAEIDDEGRANALQHVNAFYDALGQVK